jgi:hypothetical protein
MTATQIKDLTLYDVTTRFNLVRSQDASFFLEWRGGTSIISPEEQTTLDQIETDYFYLSQKPMQEGVIKLVVLARLFALAGFYQPPFRLTTEQTIKISAKDDGRVFRGMIDVLVLHDKLWVLVVESKRNALSLEPALPQALAYMVGSPYPEYPTFGLVTNGANYIFLKLIGNTYALSNEFVIRNAGELAHVLRIMKQLGQIVKGYGIN